MLEVCVDSVESAVASERAGAQRLELCENLDQGGVTPSLGKIKRVVASVQIPVFVLIRPRKGDFLYSEEDISVMLEDISLAKIAGAAGIVSGILCANGTVDVENTSKLMNQAAPLPFTFHRAFDMSKNHLDSYRKLSRLGVTRILTSGGSSSVLDGVDTILQLLSQRGAESPILLLGGGIRPGALQQLLPLLSPTDGLEFHSSASTVKTSQMEYRGQVAMGVDSQEFTWRGVDEGMIQEMNEIIKKWRT